ncbi:sigma-54-dependent transcriptional regulator [Cardiobacterium valvarum]|uniref:Response regulator/sigma54 interaction protein n=1 Tax=Cardiobacterium valvarum F0432 TaxID=797473 RepID=G9ZGP1_9GAMM|nr:sigma-54 dependent transcriptional regulator [Cardiobacterium valvarum]EHM53034.1 response regulator/sigma54 interaction protein [Cardiobacterium valvarum F0432]
MTKALIIDDERDICELIEMSLMGQDITCTSAYSVKAAIKALKEEQFNFVISDIKLPDGDGLDLLAHIQKHYPGLPVCMITAHGNMDTAIRALKLGAFDFVNKPFDLKQLRNICKAALKENPGTDGGAGNTKPTTTGGRSTSKVELIGDADIMQRVRDMIARVARSQAPVFIHGESGTGKEVAARSIHHQSNRSEGAFIAVNCGAIPENLVESEFFGYKKGAFTGANQDQDGLFVAASGGTLFLDEVADLPLSMQVKLLRAIQERAVRPIGGDREEAVDVRIISATHHDLAKRVSEGKFREDLYYRLNVIELTMPPLRERGGDIAILSRHLLAKLARDSGYPEAQLTPKALRKLENYDFPGNVRELENILERALTFVEGNMIEAEDIHVNENRLPAHNEPAAAPQPIHAYQPPQPPYPYPPQQPAYVPPPHYPQHSRDEDSAPYPQEAATYTPPPRSAAQLPDDLEDYMQTMEKNLLLKALEDCNYNKTKAAEKLGISFRAMRYKLKKLGID